MLISLARLINRYVWRYWPLILVVLILQSVGAIMGLLLPTLNARIIDQGVVKGDTGYIWQTGLLMLALSLIQVLAQIGAVRAGAKTSMSLGRDIRAAQFDRVLNFSTKELQFFGAPSLITRNTNDVQQIQMLVHMTFVMLISAPITMTGGVIMAMREDIGLMWTVLAAVVLLGAGVGILISFMTPIYRTIQQRIDDINGILREQITGIRVIRAFVREDHESSRFNQANKSLTHSQLIVGRFMMALWPFVGLVLNLSTIAVLWFGGHRISSGHLQIGQLTAFISYLMQILIAVMMTTILMVMIPRAAVCAQRINEVLSTASSLVDPANPHTPAENSGLVEFHDVSFSYPGAEEPVLRNISFTARPGQTTAIIGSTGAGKSTLVNLIPRLYDASSGSVLIDGIDVKKLGTEEVWKRIGLVPQRSYLFSGTVASNLRYGNPDTGDEELWQALDIAQATEFVEEQGLDYEISQGGTNLSGGQRQRISIARALVKKPSIYIFDDSFSALDVATDSRLRLALEREIRSATMIVVAQRVSTIRNAEQIIVLDNGSIVGIGTHDELLATNQTYQEIVKSQRSVEEAA